ncbi:uncharacterized protein LOC127466819 [Manacus candei]|uniref:uncharacterized protein LOC127466819 n=1 Tax=Manacus candei TaxID=415023 RepID=UPI0022279433|nr:uncharacterized protein LOC127466819 [Manacus candei]
MDLSSVNPSLRQQFFPNCCPMGHFSMGWSPSQMSCTSMGPPQGPQVLPGKNLLQRGLPSPRAAGLQQDPAPSWASHGVTASFRHPPAPARAPPWAAGAQLLHHGLHHGLQGLSSGAWSTSCPSFCTDLGVCLVPMFSLCSSPAGILSVPQPSILKYVITEALLLLLVGLALASGRKSILESAGIGSTGQEKLLAVSNRSHPCRPPYATKTQPQKPTKSLCSSANGERNIIKNCTFVHRHSKDLLDCAEHHSHAALQLLDGRRYSLIVCFPIPLFSYAIYTCS